MTEKEKLVEGIIEKFKRLEELRLKKTASEKRTHQLTVRISDVCTGGRETRLPYDFFSDYVKFKSFIISFPRFRIHFLLPP